MAVCDDFMADPAVMDALVRTVRDVAEDLGIPSDLLDSVDIMAASLGAFMADPTNMEALLPMLEAVQDPSMEEDVSLATGNLLQRAGYNSTDQLVSQIQQK